MKHFLRTTDLKCLTICLESGIAREDEGARFFKRRTGMTMKEYRRRVKKRGG
jgi:transcriptional regulator GlxA family with amidase domain